jgi:hypothetical protein
MEWLRKLLAEYMGLVHCDFRLEDRESEIISKKFWFIQRLVERDRIDYDRAKEWCIWNDLYNNYRITKEDALIWCIAIQDNPLSFLNDLIIQ